MYSGCRCIAIIHTHNIINKIVIVVVIVVVNYREYLIEGWYERRGVTTRYSETTSTLGVTLSITSSIDYYLSPRVSYSIHVPN